MLLPVFVLFNTKEFASGQPGQSRGQKQVELLLKAAYAVKYEPKGITHFTEVHRGLAQRSTNIGCLYLSHTKSCSEGEKGGLCELTFCSAGVDSGTYPEELVSFFQSQVLDFHQWPVCLTHIHKTINITSDGLCFLPQGK